MDLDEWIFYKKKREPGFSGAQMAKTLGLQTSYFHNVKNNRVPITSELAYKIHEFTQGEVHGWELIVKSEKKHRTAK